MKIKDHLIEFRNKFVIFFIPFCILFFIIFYFTDKIVLFVLNFYNIPINNVVSLTPFDSIDTSMALSSGISFVMVFPLIIYSILSYCKELIPTKIYKKINFYIFLCYLLAIFGFLVGIFVFGKLILINLLNEYTITKAQWGIKSVFNVIISLSITLALTMQMVLIIPFLVNNGIIKKIFLKNIAPIIFVMVMIISAIITPPDVSSMFYMTAPIFGSYYFGIIISKNEEVRKCLEQ